VINTSPLIFLSKADLLPLLRTHYASVLVPEIVLAEILQHGPLNETYQTIQQTDWLTVVETPPPTSELQSCHLDRGEEAVLAWAVAHPATEAILDDLAGRRCAQKLGIPVRGTLGLVLAAKQQGQIVAARPIIEKLRQTGMYLSDRVINEALKLVGE
jgi:predicted nucleic acid-binding protein